MGRTKLCHVTLCCLALCFMIRVTNAQNEEHTLPEGVCVLDEDLKDGLKCNSDVETTPEMESYVPEQSYCSHDTKELCVTCINSALVEMSCHQSPRPRIKRGFFRGFRRAFRSIGGGFTRFFVRKPRPVVNTKPTITCPTISSTTAPPKSIEAVVTWASATASDPQGNHGEVKLMSGKPSGSRFGQGTHTVIYKVTDSGGLTATCSVSFTVTVIRCPAPASPENGVVICRYARLGPSIVYGDDCTFACNTGYQLSGPSTVQCAKSGRFPTSPTCKKITCGSPRVPMNARSVSCTAGHVYKSVCTPVCNKGYQPGRGSRSICEANKIWAPTALVCEDRVKPVFTSCPTKKINTIDRNYKWIVTATDNTGNVTLTQTQGHPPGATMAYGTHLIKYVATDPSRNSAYCSFVVELKETDCPRPSSNDTDMKFTCNGLTAHSVCLLSCKSGSFVEGSKYIACVRDTTGNNTSYWEPVHGDKATCHKKSCPDLNPPNNGALICDKQLGGSVCQIQCQKGYDVAQGKKRFSTFICGKGADSWQPSNVAPDCLQLAFPDEYFLPTEFFYYMGDCSDTQAMNDIKQQFFINLNSIGISPCMRDVCSVEDIEVSCGDSKDVPTFWLRKKRSTNTNTKRVLHVRVTYHVKNTNRTLSPSEAAALLKSLAEKSKNVMSTNTAMRNMLFKSLPKPMMPTIDIGSYSRGNNARTGILRPTVSKPVIPSKVKSQSVTGNLTMKCARGYMQLESGSCAPCSIGTYSDQKTQTCIPCPLNTYQDKPGMTSCQRCPSHHTTLSTGTVKRSDCKEQCGTDMFSQTGLLPCFPCPDDQYQPNYGSTTCLLCPDSLHVRGISPKCLQETNKSKDNSTLQISNMLLTCESEVCLSF